MTELSALLSIRPGVTAFIGGGAKTTTLWDLGVEVRRGGGVVLCTTTRIYPFSDIPLLTDCAALPAALDRYPLVCAGTPAEAGKLAAPAASMEELAALADYVLVEADGSKGLPMKAHLSHEPVIPAEAGQTICLVGASGFGRPVRQAVHRPEVFCALTGLAPDAPVTPQAAAAALLAEGCGDILLINQCDCPGGWENAAALAAAWGRPAWGAALQKEEWRCLS